MTQIDDLFTEPAGMSGLFLLCKECGALVSPEHGYRVKHVDFHTLVTATRALAIEASRRVPPGVARPAE